MSLTRRIMLCSSRIGLLALFEEGVLADVMGDPEGAKAANFARARLREPAFRLRC